MGVNTLFLDTVWGALEGVLYGEIRAFRKSAPPVQLFTHDTSEAMEAALRLSFHDKMDVYFGVLPRTSRKGTAECTVDETDILWADFDAKNFRAKTGLASAYSEIANMRLLPHIIVDSGNGYHAYWRLDGNYPFASAQAVMKGIERQHKTDHCSDKPRILRVPGTLNFKDEPPKPVRLVRFETGLRPYSLDSFSEYMRSAAARSKTYENTGEWQPSDAGAPKWGIGVRNGALTRLAGAMVHKGLSPEMIVTNLLMENELRCDPPLSSSEVEAIARSVERYRNVG